MTPDAKPADVLCRACGYSGAIDTYEPSLAVYSDCRCPKCGSTNNQHNSAYMEQIQQAFRRADKAKKEAGANIKSAESPKWSEVKEVPCPDCYGGHFKPCNVCGDSGVALLRVDPPQTPDTLPVDHHQACAEARRKKIDQATEALMEWLKVGSYGLDQEAMLTELERRVLKFRSDVDQAGWDAVATSVTPKTEGIAPIANCACVNHDAWECAWIRDGRRARDDHDRRKCECVCHYDDRDDDPV